VTVQAGETLLHYRILEKVGEGGMGEVWKAVDTSLDREVAIKILPETLAQDPSRLSRFSREAKLLASLNHPNIATVYGYHESEGVRFLAMELVAGEDLSKRLERGAVPVGEAMRIALQVAEGLETAHASGIVHRDLKPANIMLTEPGTAKVMDFGLAKRVGGVEGDGLDSSATGPMSAASLTREGTTIGTLAYMSPEQLRAERVDSRSDVFSFGIVLYEMLTSVHPFRRPQSFETISAILRDDPPPLRQHWKDVPPGTESTIEKLLAKDPDQRFQSIGDARASLERALLEPTEAETATHVPVDALAPTARSGVMRMLRKAWVVIPVVLAATVLTAAGLWFMNRQSKVRWAREVAIPEIERLVDANWRDFTEAYELAVEAERYIPRDARLAELFAACSLNFSLTTEPAGAEIYIKNYASPTDDWQRLGTSPLEGVRLPVGVLRFKIDKPGYETVLAASSTWDITPGTDQLLSPMKLVRVLDPAGGIPAGMVRVQGAETAAGSLGDFYIDRFEVTNRQYREFVNDGGYRRHEFWEHEFIDDGKVLTWEEAMARFVDQTGRQGPATWQGGAYPEGKADDPVSGISWYEAAAYAAFAGKSLPTAHHWGLARGEATPLILFPQLGGYAVFAPFSNFGGTGPVAVGSLPGITAFGAHDMAGNVREWCFNQTDRGRAIRGGAWSDTTYMFEHISQAPAMERTRQNGFRCAYDADPDDVPNAVFGKIRSVAARDYHSEEPVSDAIFGVYRDRFSYDRVDLNARVESRNEDAEEWIKETVAYDAAYGGERIIGHLFLPRNASPPYQTVVYFPGSGSLFQASSAEIENYMEFPVFLSFLVKNGRAVLYPVYKGTFERGDLTLALIHMGDSSHRYTEFLVQLVKDFRRSIDYLETRDDIDRDRLAFYGMSWGGMLGATIPAVEDRLQASVLLSGGVRDRFDDGGAASFRPEADPLNYSSRVTIPTLMINGRYDTLLPLEHSILPMFDLLGPPDEHKELLLFDTDHIPPRNEFIRATLDWLDRYLGPVDGR
jgi:pimeloyl-ACP methyl ester carboxylesterase